ncbi:MAG: hypothetical protein ABW185_09400, partial [Sedimenticola sp.]
GRQSSSDSEPGTPVKIQKTMADMESTAGHRTIDDVYQYLQKMEQSNCDNRLQMENRLEKFETDLKSHLNLAISSLRNDMSSEFQRVDDQIKTIHEKIAQVEIVQTQVPEYIGPPKSEFDTERNICIKNVDEEDEGQSVEKLLQYTRTLLNVLDVEVKVVCAKRVGDIISNNMNTDRVRRRPRPAIVTLETVSQRSDVLKSKRKLRDNADYRNVYIEPDKTRLQRIAESNTRAIVHKITGLKLRGGRVIYEN